MSARIPLIRSAAPRIIAAFLQQLGAPVERILERVRLSPQTLENPDSLVPFSLATRFAEEAARSQGVEDLGVRIGGATQLAALGTFGRLVAQSLTLGEALETAVRNWSGFNSGVRSWMTREGDEVRLHHLFLYGDEDGWRQFLGAALIMQLDILRLVAGPRWRPTRVALHMRSLPGLRAVPLLADTCVEFDQASTAIAFPAALLYRPMPRATPPFRSTSVPGAWERSGPAPDFAGAVRQVVTTLLPDGYPDIHLVAEAIGTSVRTLQRRLGEEGLNYARAVAQVRFEVARQRLDDPSCKLIDIALDLGYSDPAHFTRAFRRWAGVAPQAFRQLRVTCQRLDAGS